MASFFCFECSAVASGKFKTKRCSFYFMYTCKIGFLNDGEVSFVIDTSSVAISLVQEWPGLVSLIALWAPCFCLGRYSR